MSAFDGIWRPDPQRPVREPDDLRLVGGTYSCLSVDPPYSVPADGRRHPIAGQDGFDGLAVTVLDPWRVRRVETLGDRVVLDATAVVGPDDSERLEIQQLYDRGVPRVDVAVRSRRLDSGEGGAGAVAWSAVASREPEAHRMTGRWQVVEFDLVNHEEDTEYRIADGVLSMRDGFGRSFSAPLDGSVVPYLGDARFSHVSVRWVDPATIEEVDRKGDEVVLTTRWTANPDGRTMHVRFEHPSGAVQEQDGQRVGD